MLFVLRAASCLFALALPVAAAAEVRVSETRLNFQFPRTETQQRSFRVEGSPLPKLVVLPAGDLVDDRSRLVILGRNITVATASRDETRGIEEFTVSIGGATRAGHYTGKLDVRPEGGTAKKLDLDVTVLATPQVEAEVNSKSPVLATRQDWLDIPWVGQWSETAPVSAKVPVYLVQTGDGEASVNQAQVLGLLSTRGPLPDKAVRIASTLPLIVGSPTAKPLELEVVAANLDPGEYKGTVAIRAQNQDALIQVPLAVRIKAGPLVPLLLLILGILAALLFSWWNADGSVMRDLVASLERLAAEVGRGKKLQADDRGTAKLQIEKPFRTSTMEYQPTR